MRKGILALLSIAFLCLSNAYATEPIQDIPSEHITQYIQSGEYGAKSSYSISFIDQTLQLGLDINLQGADPGPLKQLWKEGAENIWSDKFSILDGNHAYPIELSLNWVDSYADEWVVVHEGGGSPDMLNWYIFDPEYMPIDAQQKIVAHEVGHMLGQYDEYVGGGINPNTLFTTTDSLMSDLGPTREWNYDFALAWLEQKSGDYDLYLGEYIDYDSNVPSDGEPVPEPSTIIMFGTSLIGIISFGIKRKKAAKIL